MTIVIVGENTWRWEKGYEKKPAFNFAKEEP